MFTTKKIEELEQKLVKLEKISGTLEKKLSDLKQNISNNKNADILIRYINFKNTDIKKVLTNKKIYKDFMEEKIFIREEFESFIDLYNYVKDCLNEQNLTINQVKQILEKFEHYKKKQEEYDRYKETAKQEKVNKGEKQ